MDTIVNLRAHQLFTRVLEFQVIIQLFAVEMVFVTEQISVLVLIIILDMIVTIHVQQVMK